MQLVDVVNVKLVIEQAIVDVLSLVDLVAVGELGCHIVRLFCPDYACREGDLAWGGQSGWVPQRKDVLADVDIGAGYRIMQDEASITKARFNRFKRVISVDSLALLQG